MVEAAEECYTPQEEKNVNGGHLIAIVSGEVEIFDGEYCGSDATTITGKDATPMLLEVPVFDECCT